MVYFLLAFKKCCEKQTSWDLMKYYKNISLQEIALLYQKMSLCLVIFMKSKVAQVDYQNKERGRKRC